LRQRDGRTLTGVFLQESDGVAFARSRIEPNTKIIADETPLQRGNQSENSASIRMRMPLLA
jgi:hypothetical protein